jgi:hypothetical protein
VIGPKLSRQVRIPFRFRFLCLICMTESPNSLIPFTRLSPASVLSLYLPLSLVGSALHCLARNSALRV